MNYVILNRLIPNLRTAKWVLKRSQMSSMALEFQSKLDFQMILLHEKQDTSYLVLNRNQFTSILQEAKDNFITLVVFLIIFHAAIKRSLNVQWTSLFSSKR